MRLALLLVIPLLLLAACGDGRDAPTPPEGQDAPATPDGPTTFPATPTAQAEPPTSSPSATSNPDEALTPVIAARAALAERSGRSPEEIEVLSVTSIDWPDACLGVPTNMEVCASVITPGYEVVLSLDDIMFTYHTNQQTNVRLVIAVEP